MGNAQHLRHNCTLTAIDLSRWIFTAFPLGLASTRGKCYVMINYLVKVFKVKPSEISSMDTEARYCGICVVDEPYGVSSHLASAKHAFMNCSDCH